MAKTSAPGLALQRFIECALCDIADGYLGACAIVGPVRRNTGDEAIATDGQHITVSFDLVVGHGEGPGAVRVLNGTEAAADGDAVSRIRFQLPLAIPGPDALAAAIDTKAEAVIDSPVAAQPEDPLRARMQDPEDLALM